MRPRSSTSGPPPSTSAHLRGNAPPSPQSASAARVARIDAPVSAPPDAARYSASTSSSLTRIPVAIMSELATATAAHPRCPSFPPRIHPAPAAPGRASETVLALIAFALALTLFRDARSASRLDRAVSRAARALSRAASASSLFAAAVSPALAWALAFAVSAAASARECAALAAWVFDSALSRAADASSLRESAMYCLAEAAAE